MTNARTLALLTLSALAGCTVIVDGRISDNDATVDCTRADDGVSCGPDAICLDEACAPSRCGDAFIDTAGGEDCEDGNLVTGDGCEPSSCTYTCTEAANCDDGDPCNGSESCSATNTCVAASPPANGVVTCTQDDTSVGTCVDGLCAPEGCGDNVVVDPEECDEDSPGCLADCTWACEVDDDCDDHSVCTGTETCDVGTHTCLAGTALDCNDSETCTADSCEAVVGCEHALIDADSDGASALTCDNEGGTVSGILIHGDDCNDDNDQVSPLRSEQCDAVDHDCDGNPMNDIVNQNYYPDADGDGYPLMLNPMSACQAPPGHLLPRADNLWDCADNQAERHPRATNEWFDHPTCTISGSATFGCTTGPFVFCSYRCPTVAGQSNVTTLDWNCDSAQTERYTVENRTSPCSFVNTGGFILCSGSGWTGNKPTLGCGFSAQYQSCSFGVGGCTGSIGNRVQECQ